MNHRRFLAVMGLELDRDARRVLLSVWLVILVLLAWSFSNGTSQIRAGDSQVGGTKAFMTSQFAVAQQFAVLGLLVYGFFTAVMAGMGPVADHDLRVGEILNATPLSPPELVWGKFAASLLVLLFVALVHVIATVLFHHVLPGAAGAAEMKGPFAAVNYLVPALAFLVPIGLLVAGSSFAVGRTTRSPVLVFVLPTALFMACVFFLWDWSPAWLDPRINRALMLLDPTGFRWLSETWLKVDRGVAFYNHATIPFDLGFVVSRLAYAGAGLAAVAVAERHDRRMLRGARVSTKDLAAAAALTVAAEDSRPRPGPLSALGMASTRPGFLAGAWMVARAELRELRSSAGLYLFVPLILLQTIGIALVAVGAFDTPLLATPGTLAVSAMEPLTIMVCLLLLFYTVESILREQRVQLDTIAYATPLRTGSLLLGKVSSCAVVGVVIPLATLLADLIILAIQGRVPFRITPFALMWGLLLVPTFLGWTAFVAAILALTRGRYATYALGFAALVYSARRFLNDEMNWLGNWPLWKAVRWSDLSILELDRQALILSRVWVLALAAGFTALTVVWFTRRERDATSLYQRIRPRALLILALRIAPVVVPIVVVGVVLGRMIDVGTGGDSRKKQGKDYWKQNLATWKDARIPDIKAVDITMELEPASSWFRVSGTYTLVNRTGGPLRSVPITAGFHWSDIHWTWDGAEANPKDQTRLYVFSPVSPLAAGASAVLGFRYEGRFPDGITRNGGGAREFILPSAVVLTSFGSSFAPALGYLEDLGVDEDNTYEARRYPDDFYLGRTEPAFGSGASMTTRIKVSAPAEFTVNSVGEITAIEESAGRRAVTWVSDRPVHFFNVVAGKWAVRHGDRTAIFYHPTHVYNIDELSSGLDAARKYYSEWFYPYPWKELKLSEFPALASYAQGFPTNITFSESIGFLTDARDKPDVAFLVTAHEAAHQWWGNLLLPGKGPGGNILSEGLAHYSTAMLMEQVKGPKARIEFLKQIEKSYGETRKADEERPLVWTDGSLPTDTTVTYDRGGWVFWMLMHHMGRDKMLKGLHAFIEKYHATDDFPVLQDFLATMRPFSREPAAFDDFAKQWFFAKSLPEYQLTDARKRQENGRFIVSATLTNQGTGSVKVDVAAEHGDRFDKAGKPDPGYRVQSTTITVGPGESRSVEFAVDFEPARLVVDPDVRVLQLFRGQAKADL